MTKTAKDTLIAAIAAPVFIVVVLGGIVTQAVICESTSISSYWLILMIPSYLFFLVFFASACTVILGRQPNCGFCRHDPMPSSSDGLVLPCRWRSTRRAKSTICERFAPCITYWLATKLIWWKHPNRLAWKLGPVAMGCVRKQLGGPDSVWSRLTDQDGPLMEAIEQELDRR